LPDFQSKRITAKAIGGVKLGMTPTQVASLWGWSGGRDYSMDRPCAASASQGGSWECQWRKSPTTKAWVHFSSSERADYIGIAGSRTSRPGQLRTSEKLGLGTRTRTLFSKPGCQSSPAGLGGPVPGVGVVYLCGGIRYHGSRSTGRTIAVSIGRPG